MLGSAFALALAANASAAQIDGWYVGLEGGASWVDDWSHTINGSARTSTFDTGWVALATVGYGWNHWRLEFEAGYRDNELASYLNPAGVPIAGSAGTLWEGTAMINALYDLSLTDKLSLSLGLGAGGDFSNNELTLAGLGTAEDDAWSFAYQGIAGINYMVTRRTQLFLDYRYLRVMEPDYTLVFPIGPSTRVLSGDDYGKHAATFGIRYALQPAEASYVAPPPGPSAPPPVAGGPPRQFIVFFGFNKYTLTTEAQRVISEAVSAAKDGGSASVLITGHTDTVGSNSYNQRLSMRRSNTVRAEMVRQGVPNGSITSTGRGETELLVQTADGVKEPQNRRATIDLN